MGNTKLLLNETDWLPVADNGWTVDGRRIYEDIFKSIVETFDTSKHIPYWTIGHQTEDNTVSRVGSIKDIKYENGILYVKSFALDKDFIKDVENFKYPHLSIEIYPMFMGIETREDEDIEKWGFMFNGVAAIGRNAAFPQYHLVKFENQQSTQMFLEEPLQFPVDITDKYIRVRVRLTKDFKEGSFKTIDIDKEKGIKSVVGILKETGKTDNQNFMFDVNEWTEDKAVNWVKEHGHKILSSKVEPVLIFISNYDKNFMKGVKAMAEATKTDDILKEEIESEPVEIEEVEIEKEEKPKKVGRPRKEEDKEEIKEELNKYSSYGKDYNLKKLFDLEQEVKDLKEKYKTKTEKIEEMQEQMKIKDDRIDRLKDTISGQDFIINAQYYLSLNKINYNDLEIPTSVMVNEPKDFIEHSELYKKHWKNEHMREYVLTQWENKEAKKLYSGNIGDIDINANREDALTDEEICKRETERRCRANGVMYNSSEGLKIEQKVWVDFATNPSKIKKNLGLKFK